MKVKDILDIAHGRVIAWDARTGEILFDSYRNNQNHVRKYGEGNVTEMWKLDVPNMPAIGMYVEHNSWLEGENGNE